MSLFAPPSHSELAGYLTNIGALIAPLDLRPAEDKGTEATQKTGVSYGLLIGVLVVAAVVAGGACYYFLNEQNKLEAQQAALQSEIAALQAMESSYATFMEAENYATIVEDYHRSTSNDNEALLDLIIILEEIMPQGLSLSGLDAGDGGISTSVTSAVNGKRGAAQLLIELKKIPFISDVWIPGVSDAYDEFDHAETSFSISFTINKELASLYMALKAAAEGGTN
jgi:hypothetical protein